MSTRHHIRDAHPIVLPSWTYILTFRALSRGYATLGILLGGATTAGDAFLAEHRNLVNGGTLTVSRPILDRETGRMVMPWEIRPGHLIRVRGLAARADSLNPAGRDGVTIFRIVGVSFDAGTVTARLDLDTYPRSIAQGLAQLAKKLGRPNARRAR